LLIGVDALKNLEDLSRFTLLHDASPDNDESCPDWTMWLKAARIKGVDGSRGLRFNQSSLVLEAAISGRGVALAKSTLAADDLAAGRLSKPFDLTLPIDFAYYLVCPRSKANLPKVENFTNWVRTLAAAEEIRV
jgi:LysR family glycine cleavage system transcriptional activator